MHGKVQDSLVGKKEEMYFIQGAYWILFVYEKDFTSKNKVSSH